MRKLTMLGTGNAMVTKCYNTCFYVTLDDGALFLTDAGGGNGILRQLIRQYLGAIPNVTHYADEHVQFGGAGITVVDF